MGATDVANAERVLHEIASQAYSLAMGLQNAAPSPVSGPSKSVQYLLEASIQIEKARKDIEAMILAESSRR